MKKHALPRILRWLALGVVASGAAIWLSGGARVGWTTTSSITMQHDEITGIEYPVRHASFQPGVEIPLIATAIAAILAGGSYVSRRRLKSSDGA